jgi:ABC-type transport system involved in multi-copper enzyme maturation permease subunit
MPKSIAIQGQTPFSSRTLVIARYTLIEAWRNRFGLLLAGIIVAALLASVFVRQQAITESTRSQIAFLAAALRAGSVFLICIAVIQGSVREIQEKGLEMMLSLDLPRASYLVGKFIGYALLCLVCAVVVSLPLLMLADFSDVLRWAYTHLLELWIVIAFAVLCVTSFSQFASAATLVLAFYVLARSVTAIQLMSQSTIAASGPAAEFTAFLVEFIALVLPRMDAFTQTAWLIDAPVTPLTIPGASLQAAIYVTLLLSAAIFDLHRRNL